MPDTRWLRPAAPLRRIVPATILVIASTAFANTPRAQSAENDSPLGQSTQLLIQGETKKARKTLEEFLKTNPGDAKAHHALTLLLLEEEKTDAAIEHAERAVEIEGGSAPYHLLLARTLAAKAMAADLPEDAVEPARRGFAEYERALVLDPADRDSRFEVFAYYLRAPDALGGNFEKAQHHAEIIRSTDPVAGAVALAWLVRFREGEGKGEAYIKGEIARDTTQQATLALGRFLSMQGRSKEAAEVFRGVLNHNPNNMIAVYQLGKARLQGRENLEEAAQCFLRYLETTPRSWDPTWAAAHCRLGMVYDAQGQKEQALEQVRQAVRMEPDNLDFRRELRSMLKGSR